jgi:predicted Zn finger-like uncharacterized protein
MILSCKACQKKFVVPDQAITASGRIVQCGSCGNKWKQFPVQTQQNIATRISKVSNKKTPNLSKVKKKNKKIKKTREIDLYSPEYLKKKHGISLNITQNNNKNKSEQIVSFGFYNSLILFAIIIIAMTKILHFSQFIIIQKLPFTEFYIDYFFESIKNIFEISKNLISSY